MNGLIDSKSWAKPHDAARRPIKLSDTLLPGSRRRRRQQQHQGHVAVDARANGRDAGRIVARLLDTVHAPLVKTPGERARMRKFLERLGEADYGYGWRSYDYAGHHIVGHRGGVTAIAR